METVVDDLRDFLQANLPQSLDQVAAKAAAQGRPSVSLSLPEANQYFIGEKSVYRAYSPPAIFLIPSRASRVTDNTGADWDTLLRQNLRVQVMALLEGVDHESIVRACMRMAEAIDQTLRDQEVTPSSVTSRSTKVRIPTIDLSNVLVRSDGNVFRGEVWLECVIMHWDQLTW